MMNTWRKTYSKTLHPATRFVCVWHDTTKKAQERPNPLHRLFLYVKTDISVRLSVDAGLVTMGTVASPAKRIRNCQLLIPKKIRMLSQCDSVYYVVSSTPKCRKKKVSIIRTEHKVTRQLNPHQKLIYLYSHLPLNCFPYLNVFAGHGRRNEILLPHQIFHIPSRWTQSRKIRALQFYTTLINQ